MDADGLDRMLGSFRHSVARLETLPAYTVGGAEAERMTAFRQHQPRPERSVRTNAYLAKVARQALRGRTWQRVRLADNPLTEYQRYQLIGYAESAAVGETVLIADRSALAALADLREDFWLFDRSHRSESAVILSYTDAGEFTGARRTRDPADLSRCRHALDLAASRAVPLNEYLAVLEERQAA